MRTSQIQGAGATDTQSTTGLRMFPRDHGEEIPWSSIPQTPDGDAAKPRGRIRHGWDWLPVRPGPGMYSALLLLDLDLRIDELAGLALTAVSVTDLVGHRDVRFPVSEGHGECRD